MLLVVSLLLMYIFVSFTWNSSFFCAQANCFMSVGCVFLCLLCVYVISRFTEIRGNRIQRPKQRQLQQLLATSLDPVEDKKEYK